MAGRAAAKNSLKRKNRLQCRVIGVRSAYESREATVDFAGSPIWGVQGSLGPHSLSPRALDLVDLVGGIYRVESQIPLRPTNPPKEWQLHAPVRDVGA